MKRVWRDSHWTLLCLPFATIKDKHGMMVCPFLSSAVRQKRTSFFQEAPRAMTRCPHTSKCFTPVILFNFHNRSLRDTLLLSQFIHWANNCWDEWVACGLTASKWQDLDHAAWPCSPHFICPSLICHLQSWPHSHLLLSLRNMKSVTNLVLSLMLNCKTSSHTSRAVLRPQDKKNKT